MRIAGLVQDSIVDGPGIRFAVFTQGCKLCCEGCHNPSAWDAGGGTEMTASEVIAVMNKNPLTDGLTLSGGEPFLQAADCSQLAAAAHEKGLNVWTYTGSDFGELFALAQSDMAVKKLLELSDVMIDGQFKLSERSLSIKWRGSRNQHIIDVRKSLATGEAVEVEL